MMRSRLDRYCKTVNQDEVFKSTEGRVILREEMILRVPKNHYLAIRSNRLPPLLPICHRLKG